MCFGLVVESCLANPARTKRSTHTATQCLGYWLTHSWRRVILIVRQQRTATKLKLRSHTFRPSTIFLLIVFVATVLWHLKTSAEDRRSEIKLIGTWEIRLTEDRIATTATRLIQHSEHEIRGQVSRPGPVSRHLTTVRKILEIHFVITMLFACGRGVSFFAFDGLGDGAGRLSDRCSGTRGRT